MFLKLIVFLATFAGLEGSLDEQCTVPMWNRYTPRMYAIESVPEEINYKERQCKTIGSYLKSEFVDYESRGVLTSAEASAAFQALLDCKSSLCDDSAMQRKLQEPMVVAELVALGVSHGKTFDPEYEVFEWLVDPLYWEIMSDVPYPIVEQQHFGAQNEAAFQIISKVCGHQKPTLKADLIPEKVNEIFISILVENYVRYAFDSLGDSLKVTTNPEKLESLWRQAANQRYPSGVCLDDSLTSDGERTTISRIRDIAESLDISCAAQFDIDYDTSPPIFGSVGSAPSGPGGSNAGAPGSPHSSASWAAPPSPGSRYSSFAPGTSG